MRNQKGFIGCSNLLVIIWIVFMLAFWGLIVLNRNLFYVPPEEMVLTSRVAAKRCRKKLKMFNTNEYIKSISLNELEINSALHQEFTQSQHEPFLSVTVEMEPERLSIEATVVLVELIPKNIRSILGKGDMEQEEKRKRKQEDEEEKRRKAVIKMVSQPMIKERGELFLDPQEMVIGKQRIPHFIIRTIHKMKPHWFNHSISKKVKTIKIKENELELIKW